MNVQIQFIILAPFLEKDVFGSFILEYLREKLPLVDGLVVYE